MNRATLEKAARLHVAPLDGAVYAVAGDTSLYSVSVIRTASGPLALCNCPAREKCSHGVAAIAKDAEVVAAEQAPRLVAVA